MRVYAVVNCGFPEPEINEQAVEVIGRFAASVCASLCACAACSSVGCSVVVLLAALPALRRSRFPLPALQRLAQGLTGLRCPAAGAADCRGW